MSIEPIKITGLTDFIRNLKKLDGELPKAVRLAGNEAAQIVVDAAKPLVPEGPPAGGHARDSIKARSTRTQVRIQAGGTKYPYYPWLDFGGRVGRNRSVRRPFLKSGRYVWKAYAEHKKQVQDKLQEALVNIAREAGVEVSE